MIGGALLFSDANVAEARGLRLAINGVGAHQGGIVRVLECVVGQLSSVNDVEIFNAPHGAEFPPTARVINRQHHSRLASVARSLVPRIRRTFDVRIDIAPGFCAGVRGSRMLTLVHDLAYLHPDLHYVRKSQRSYRRIVTSWAVRRSDELVCVSGQTQHELAVAFPASARKARVLRLPVEHIWRPFDSASAPVRKRVHRDGQRSLRVLAICKAPNKGLEVVLDLAARREEIRLRLVTSPEMLANSPAWPHLADAVRSRIDLVLEPSDLVLRREYLDADVYVMPSRFEGYGLPVAEALACGTPTVVSDLDVLSDTGLGYPARARGWSTEALSQAVDDALARTPDHWVEAARSIRRLTWSAWCRQLITGVMGCHR